MAFSTNTKYSYDLMDVVRLFYELDSNVPDISVDVFESSDGYICNITVDGKSFTHNFDVQENSKLVHTRLFKRQIKLCLYKVLASVTQRNMVWGSLTGIRPTKIAYDFLERCPDGDVVDYFVNEFLVSESKARLVADIIGSQSGLVDSQNKYVDIYVGIPFCVSRCSYCSFSGGTIDRYKNCVDAYVDALIDEISSCEHLIEKPVRCVYVGGGTPTSLNAHLLEKVLKVLPSAQEFTVEAGRPDTVDSQKLEVIRKYSDRISINPQTFNADTLVKVNRKHSVKDIYDSFDAARRMGFVINMDLIAGLPDESFDDFKNSVDAARLLRPDNITVHTLALKSGALLKEQRAKHTQSHILSKMVEYARLTLSENEYKPYYMYRQKYMGGNLENTGYCLSGKVCLYNIDIMEETTDILAFGAGAISKKVSGSKIQRAANIKDVELYISKCKEMVERKNALFLSND